MPGDSGNNWENTPPLGSRRTWLWRRGRQGNAHPDYQGHTALDLEPKEDTVVVTVEEVVMIGLLVEGKRWESVHLALKVAPV